MTVSIVSICNQALSKIKVSAILSLTENSRQARLCSLIYDDALAEALTLRAWNFATARIELAQLTASPLNTWEYAYQLPVDCLQVLELTSTYVDKVGSLDYKIEGDQLLCNYAIAEIIYIKVITDMGELSPLFRAYFTSFLAYEMCYSLSGSVSLKDRMLQESKMKLMDAKVADGMENNPRLVVNSRVIDVRYGR